jgi:hypothetical protein
VTTAVALTPPAEAVTVTVCAADGVPAVAVNVALVESAGTVTEAGTVSQELLSDTVTANPPVGAALVRVTVQVEAAPGARVAGVQLSADRAAGAASDSEALAEVPLRVAVICAVASVVTAATVAVKVAEVAPAATVTEEGVVTLALLSDRATLAPPVGAATFSVTVQVAEPAALNDEGAQLSEDTTGAAGGTVICTDAPVAVTGISLPFGQDAMG